MSIRQALEKLGAAIAADPAKARAKTAPAMGGTASGPDPGWLLRGALASCTATVIAMRAAKLGVTLKVLEVTVETDSDHRGILGLDDTVSAGMRNLRPKVRIAGSRWSSWRGERSADGRD